MSFVNVDKAYRPDSNFWELNPQLAIMPPFDKLYKEDDGGDLSSKKMWCIFFMSDPDEDDNKFYRVPIRERKEMLREVWCPEIDWEDEVIQECLTRYPYVCLTTLQRDLKEQKEMLIRINKYLDDLPLTIDTSDGKTKIPGTITQITKAKKELKVIYDYILQLEEQVSGEKSKTQVYGGRQETFSEQKLI